jgi:hypothetical protein
MFNSHNSTLGCMLIRRPLGRILLDGEFISPEELKRALEEQKHTNELLGEILVQMGLLDPIDLKAVLSISRDLASFEDAVKLAAGVRRNLGDLLLQAGRITPDQLELALQEQKQTGEKLGEVLVRHGLINSNEINAVLAFQQNQEIEGQKPGLLRLGEILVATNQISRDQLNIALAKQKLSRKNIGDILIEEGYIHSQQLFYGLNLQKKLLTSALVAVLSLAPLSAVQAAEPVHQDASSVSSKTKIAEEIQRHTALKVVHQTSELVITQADIIRGYIDIPAGANIEIQNNNLGGYMIFFMGIGTPFKEVLVKGLGGEVKINSNGGWIAQPYNGRDPVMAELSYRFILSENAKPGTYAWPLTISVSPILPV